MIHVGLDASLTSFGVAVLSPGGVPAVTHFSTKPTGATLAERHARLDSLVQNVRTFVVDHDQVPGREARVYIEAPPYGKTPAQGSAHDRSGLWWLVVQRLIDDGYSVIEVSPTKVKSFGAGKGNADKTAMTVAAAREFPGVALVKDDEVDALWLAALSEYVEDPDAGRVARTKQRDVAANGVPKR